MEVRQLQTFVAVASELSFTRAADQLHTVQSAVSATIGSLEREVGTQLFDRSLRQIRLTPAGKALLPRARDVLDAVRAARDAVDATGTEVTGSVALGYMTSVTLVDIPVLLRDFTAQHGRVEIRLKAAEHGTAGLIDMLRSSQLDLALLMPYEEVPDLEVIPVRRSPLHLTVPAGHPLAGEAAISLDRLSDERFVDFPDGFGPRELADTAFRSAGVPRHVGLETMDIANLGALVEAGLGIAFLPEFISGRLPHSRVVPLKHELPDMTVAIATLKRRPLGAAARALRTLILQRRHEPRGPAAPSTG